MTAIEIVSLLALALAAVPAVLVAGNLRRYRPPSGDRDGEALAAPEVPGVSVLIPARNEADKIERTVNAVRANRGVDLEILVMDDASDDGTGEIVAAMGKNDPRVRMLEAPPLPAGWNGKQHACWRLAQSARHDLLLFLDADVVLSPTAVSAMVNEARRPRQEGRGADMISGIPRQVTGTIMERLLIPLIHFVLLGFLPIGRMRRSRQPAYAAGCGQLMLVSREAYFAAGGHEAIRASRHDGIQLPRAFRRRGAVTDLFDATPLATCRMYRAGSEVWNGLAKNATEGMASPAAILPWSLLLLGGQVLPPILLAAGLFGLISAPAAIVAGLAWLVALATRLRLALRFRQSRLAAWLHPLGVALLLAIQWFALTRKLIGRPITWKGRTGEAASDVLRSA